MKKLPISTRSIKKSNFRFHYDDYVLLSEDNRYEILGGIPHTVSASNIKDQRLLRNLEFALIRHVTALDLGELFHSPCDVILSHDNIVQPDIIFVRKDRAGIIGDLNLHGAPDLVIENHSNAALVKTLRAKRRIYASFGIQEYWIVDSVADSIEVLAWSELGYISVGIYGKSDQLSSLLLPDLGLHLSRIFPE